ncbi:MAG: conjugal transfer protein TraO, partial [Tannerellaceae bacterium]|nr:conjugal transfer protein TraO [Tannerellaceae bacterium]
LEIETYLSDRVVLLLTGCERILFGSDMTKFHTQFGVGLRFMLN